MTEQDQIKALAELDGWHQQEVFESSFADSTKQVSAGLRWTRMDSLRFERKLPDYLTSYDAIIPLIQKQLDTVFNCFLDNLCIIKNSDDAEMDGSYSELRMMWMATPTQLCEALLRATGKWKDKP